MGIVADLEDIIYLYSNNDDIEDGNCCEGDGGRDKKSKLMFLLTS